MTRKGNDPVDACAPATRTHTPSNDDHNGRCSLHAPQLESRCHDIGFADVSEFDRAIGLKQEGEGA
jgi:hypothetical protein